MRHVNIPVFIPHLGCPHDCVFCNQRTISGQEDFDSNTLESLIDEALGTVDSDDEVEIAFFGGSFTGIDRGLMISLLERAHSYLKAGRVKSLRCSTRPDYIDDEILDILERYGMTTVELGIQSTSERVLAASRRGHTGDDARRACRMIKARGFRLGGQMMIGLPASVLEDEIKTAEEICALGCDEARIYPTIVFDNTALGMLMQRGEYTPLTVQEAAERSARILRIFDEGGVKVLRVGLCDAEGLHSSKCLGGPVHPAMGELSRSVIFREDICRELDLTAVHGEDITVYVPRGAVSAAIGNRRVNKDYIMQRYGIRKIRFCEDEKLRGYEIKIARGNL